MKILVLSKGFHGVEPMFNLLEQHQITNAQFLLHSTPGMKAEYERYCTSFHKDPYDEDVATQYLNPWLTAWRMRTSKRITK